MKMSKRHTLILLLIAGYLLLNWGFMLVRIPPIAGGGVPVGEMLLGIWFCFLIKDLRWLPHFTNNIIFVPFLLWWIFGIGKALYAVPEYGMWALRDATHVIESLFLWVGFVFAGALGAMDRLFIWLRRILVIGTLYGFSYPWREELGAFSPTILSAAGYVTPFFFHYVGSGHLILMESVRRLIGLSGGILVPGLLIAYTMGIFQSRTHYLQLIVIVLMLLWYRGKAFKKMSMALGVGLLAFVLLAEFGPEIKGRNEQNISLDFIARHFVAIAGIKSEGVEGAAEGVPLRLGWWEDIMDRLLENKQNLIFGLGYGFPLIDFSGPVAEVVREPHNSYISIFARLGILGILLFSSAHIFLLRSWWISFKLCRRMNYRIGQDRLFLLMVYFVLIWTNSFGEDAFEKPFYTIPYYFFWGVVLQYRFILLSLLNPNKSQPDEDPEMIAKPELLHSPELRVR